MDKNRIVILIDMDCFYVQCEQRLQPDKWSKPCAVAQYNNWRGGGIIAVNYEARTFGVRRGMRGDDAKHLCPELHIFSVPDENGKAKLDRYREASIEVFNVIGEFISEQENDIGQNLIILERASVDEAFIDFTRLIDAKPLMLPEIEDLNQWNTRLELDNISLSEWLNKIKEFNQLDDVRLLMGAILTGKLRQLIFEKTQFQCSAGISHNKMLSKLACGINKPNAQTILPMDGVPILFQRIDISDVRLLGGKLGQQIKQIFAIKTMHEMNQIDQELMAQNFDERTATWLHNLSCGFDEEPVSDRRITKSIGCGKNFRGKNALTKWDDIHHWIKILLQELYARIVKDKELNKRIAKLMVVGYYTASKGHCSRSVQIDVVLGDYPKPDKIATNIMKTVFSNQTGFDPILNLSIAATKFVEKTSGNRKIDKFFKKIDENHVQKVTKDDATKELVCSKNLIRNTIEKYFRIIDNNQDDGENVSEEIINFNIDDDPVEDKMQEDFDLLLESFFFKKLLIMIENNELMDFDDDEYREENSDCD